MHTTVSILLEVVMAAPAPQPKSIHEVIGGLTGWVRGICGAVATFYLALAALRYTSAGGDTGLLEQAKSNLKSAFIGYALMILAPVLLQALQGILGG